MTDIADKRRTLEGTMGGSTYVKPAQMDWKPTRFEKISIKVLYEDAEKGEMTCLLKLEPGAYVPFHKHPEVEQSFVLEGSVEDHDGVATAGDYIWRKPGSQHDKAPCAHCSCALENGTVIASTVSVDISAAFRASVFVSTSEQSAPDGLPTAIDHPPQLA